MPSIQKGSVPPIILITWKNLIVRLASFEGSHLCSGLSFVSISFGSYFTGACKPSMIFVSGLSTPDQLVLFVLLGYPVLCSQNSCHLFSVAAQNIYYSYFPLGL